MEILDIDLNLDNFDLKNPNFSKKFLSKNFFYLKSYSDTSNIQNSKFLVVAIVVSYLPNEIIVLVMLTKFVYCKNKQNIDQNNNQN